MKSALTKRWGRKPQASRYRPSARCYPGRLEEPQYAAAQAVRRVRSNGEIRWGGELVFLSESLVGEPVALPKPRPAIGWCRSSTFHSA